MVSVDPDHKPNPWTRAWALATLSVLRFLARLGFLGSMLIYGAIAGISALVIWGLSGREIFDWKFVIAFSVGGPLIVDFFDYLICRNDRRQ